MWHGGRYHAIAFLIPNRERVEGGFGDYALSVNDLERQLGYDLFWRLPDSIEERVEGELDRTFWKCGRKCVFPDTAVNCGGYVTK